jgi:radical SAM-linked protein
MAKKTLVVKFRIMGNLRFLSHLETAAMLRRALVRAGIEICYSEGFNPRPKMSLPLPRSVGVQSDDELLYASMVSDEPCLDQERLKEQIRCQLPQGCEVISIALVERKTSFQPVSAVYVFSLTGLAGDEKIKDNLDSLRRALATGERVVVERRADKNRPFRKIDVSGYIDSVECEEDALVVKCNITPSGSVRIDEILQLLQIDFLKLAVPVKRKTVQWKQN